MSAANKRRAKRSKPSGGPKQQRTTSKPAEKGVNLIFPILAVVINLACVLVSIELTHIHYGVHTDPNFSSFCAINETVNCDTVANSSWAMLWGVPI